MSRRRCARRYCQRSFEPAKESSIHCSRRCAAVTGHSERETRYFDAWVRLRKAQEAAKANEAVLLAGSLQPRATTEGHAYARNIDCVNSRECLSIAIKCEWKGFHCAACDSYEATPVDIREHLRNRDPNVYQISRERA